jgi:proton glutamate symport protein
MEETQPNHCLAISFSNLATQGNIMTEATAQESSNDPVWKIWKWKMHWQILFSLLVGAVIGLGWALMMHNLGPAEAGPTAAHHAVTFGLDVMKLIGDLFLNGLKLVVVPLIVSSIVLSIAGLGTRSGFGRMATGTLLYYMCTSLFAILIGLCMVNLMQPGRSSTDKPLMDAQTAEKVSEKFSAEMDKVDSKKGSSAKDVLSVFRNLVPSNPIAAAADTNLLGLITISILIGIFMPKLSGHLVEFMQNFWQSIHDLTMMITNFILAFAPLGVGCLLAATVAEQGTRLMGIGDPGEIINLLRSILLFAVTALLALGIHLFVVMPLVLAFVAKVNPIQHYRAMLPAMLTAFSTSSSNASLPVTIECVEERVGVSRRTASFVLPLGATVNMDGTALYECVAAIFVVQLFGFDLTLGEQFFVVLTALLTSIGVAGVPSASLVAIVIIITALESQLIERGVIPAGSGTGDSLLLSALPLILVFDRFLDMSRTVVNIFSDSCGAVVIGKAMGDQDLYTRKL